MNVRREFDTPIIHIRTKNETRLPYFREKIGFFNGFYLFIGAKGSFGG